MLFDTAKKEGLVKDSSELLFPKFYFSRDSDFQWTKKYIEDSVKKYAYRYTRNIPLFWRQLCLKYNY